MALLILSISTSVFAVNTNNTQIDSTSVTDKSPNISQSRKAVSSIDIKQKEDLASSKTWGVTIEDWQKYQTYMQGQGQYFYKDVSPLEVLAITADNPEDMKKYTDIWVKLNHEKISKELEFNVMYRQEMKKLYPNELPLKPFDTTPFAPPSSKKGKALNLTSGDELILFTKDNSLFANQLVKTLIKEVKDTSKTSLSIYVIGNRMNPSELQVWSSSNQIPADMVKAGKIHINSGNDKYNAKINHEKLPLVVLKRNGQLTQITNL